MIGATAREIALAAALLVSVIRSVLLYGGAQAASQGFGRRFATEAALLGSGLAIAFVFSPAAGALSFWGFFLAQSGFFLVGGSAARARRATEAPSGGDPFEEACDRVRDVLERGAHEAR